jgi:protoporphyrinogen oxidase
MRMTETPTGPVVIFGAGPAGLTAAHELARNGVNSIILERDEVVGGLARTVNYKGYLFDLGGHRFFTKVSLIERIWKEVLGDDLLLRSRLSRIYYNSKFYQYPLEPLDVIRNLGVLELARCGASYLRAKLWPKTPEPDLATWVSNRFGVRLYRKFFKSYTEKVWGIPCEQIRAEWAAQRIRGLSFTAVVRNAILHATSNGKSKVRSLTKEFLYPRRGPGMMWSAMCEGLLARGNTVLFGAPVEKICWDGTGVAGVFAGGRRHEGTHYISSLPIRELIRSLDPAPPVEVQRAADDFSYRDFLTVALIVDGYDLFPDNWIYVHDPNVRVGRIQNYTNWSPDMTPEPGKTCLGLEYFCTEGDDLWSLSDEQLLELGRREIGALGLAGGRLIQDGTVVRVRKAYPVYDERYKRGLDAIRGFLPSLPNLQLVGRNGQHCYNNQDHSMLAGVLAARNVLGANIDLWDLNTDQDYQEEGDSVTDAELEALRASQPLVPRRMEAGGD